MNVAENIPVFYLLTWTLKLFATMIPAIACMWAITVLLKTTIVYGIKFTLNNSGGFNC